MGALAGLDGLTSLTGGGALSTGSSAANGDFGAENSYSVGNMNFNSGGGDNNQMLMIGAIALVGLMLWMKK